MINNFLSILMLLLFIIIIYLIYKFYFWKNKNLYLLLAIIVLSILSWRYIGVSIINITSTKDLLLTDLSNINIENYAQSIDNSSPEYNEFIDFSKDAKKEIIISKPVKSNFNIDDVVGNKEKIEYIYKNFSKRFKINTITSWYIHIISSVNGWELNTQESVYLYLNNEGGHLLRPESIIYNKDDWKTHIIFNLNNIIFAKLPKRWYDETVPMKNYQRNFIKEMNNRTNYIFWFVSTNRFGELEKIEIIYK